MCDQGICYIFGAGEQYGPPPAAGPRDFVIAADGGYLFAKQAGVRVDLVVGDFDSLGQPPKHETVITLPREKDDTDMLAAVRIGLERGHRIFHLYGGTGGRLDHTLANIQCIAGLAARGARGYLHDKASVITAVCNGSVAFAEGSTGTVSVFSFSDRAEGVCESGLQYALEDATLTSHYPVGISNAFTGVRSRISVRAGTLIIIYPNHIEEETP